MKNQAVTSKKLLLVREVANALRCSPRTVYRMIQQGELRGVRVRSSLRVFAASIDDYLDREAKRLEHEIGGASVWDELADFVCDD